MPIHDRDVARCTAEIRSLLPALSAKHTPLVLIAALAEHVGGSLCLTRQDHDCTPEEAQAILERVRRIAFAT